ncbi:ferredoxin [Catenulispora pinisilvae]|uniref:ferredoxin n=1 Tax=Catenulispora pinisilvae TaxID=2705253 RepID=UPI0018927F60|nr:ferredoxin [Catenulispora pinisilvae]
MEHAGIERLLVDRNRCEGYGMCQQAAPDLIHLDDEDEPVIDVAELSAAHKPLANAAVRACPVAALTLSGPTAH